MKTKFPVLLLSILFAVAATSLADACPTCKESINEHGGNLVQGYFLSIIFMMSMPFLIFGGMSTMFYLDVRRARRLQDAANQSAILPVGT